MTFKNVTTKLTKTKLALIFGALLIAGNIATTQTASALSGSDWRAGKIIDDSVFFNKDAMSPQQIQTFLNAKVPVCDRNNSYKGTVYGSYISAPYTCLKEYNENPSTKENNIGRFNPDGSPYQVPGGIAAAQIIWNAGQAYGINPQSLIVMLQKETAIVTDTWAAKWQYDRAMGYGCPDSGPGGSANCNTNYYGFYNQVSNAAWQLKRYGDVPDSYNFKAGVTRYIQYDVNTACGGTNVFIENRATAALYNYTPYQPNATALSNIYGGQDDGCSAYGNRNFWRMFNDWFGSSTLPKVLRASDSSIVYMISNGYKFAIPSMAVLQDYGFDPNSITVVPSSYVNPIPSGDSIAGQSNSINYLVKSISDSDEDGGAVYVVTLGKKYALTSMDQFNNYGFSTTNISYLPLAFLNSLHSGGALSNFIYSPTNNAFQVANGSKRIVFDYQKYLQLNPSGATTPVSYFFANGLPSLSPISDSSLLVRLSSGAIFLYTNSTYYSLPSMDSYDCWGFASGNGGPLYNLADDTYISGTTNSQGLSCASMKSTGSTYLLNGSTKFDISNGYSISGVQYNSASIDAIIDKLPTTSPLKNVIKSNGSSAIWVIDSGKKRLVPTMRNYNLLAINPTLTTQISSAAINAIPTGEIKLASGLSVKSSDSQTVFNISGNERIAYQSSDNFLSYGNTWSNIETYPGAFLNNSYPSNGKTMNRYAYKQSTQEVFLIDSGKCYKLNSVSLVNYGQTLSTIIAQQSFGEAAFNMINLTTCSNGSDYIKGSSNTVYRLSGGYKTSIPSWGQLLASNNGTPPAISTYSDVYVNSLPNSSN